MNSFIDKFKDGISYTINGKRPWYMYFIIGALLFSFPFWALMLFLILHCAEAAHE